MVLVIHTLQDHLHLEEVVEEDTLLLEPQLNLVQILVFLESHNMVMLVEVGLVLEVWWWRRWCWWSWQS